MMNRQSVPVGSVPPATVKVEPTTVPSKYVKVWEGNLSGQRQGQPVFITRLQGYGSASASSESLAANWPPTMQIVGLISQDHMNNKQYVGKADFLVFRAMNQHGLLRQLQEKKLCAVIQLPSQTLVLYVSDKPWRLIGMLFPREDRMRSMDTVFNCVIPYIQNAHDRKSVSLVCHKWNEIEGFTRKHVTVHMHYAPTPSRLSKRFPFLVSLTLKGVKDTKESIDLTDWIPEIAIKLTRLKSLRIRHLVIHDSDLKLLAENRGKDLLSLKIHECKGFSENGLMCVAKDCSELTELCLERIDLVVDDVAVEERGKWLRVLALRKTGIKKFSYMYGGVTDTPFGQEDIAFLAEKCRDSLVSLRVDSCYIGVAAQAISNAVNLQDYFGSIFYEDEQYNDFKLPSSIHNLGLSYFPESSIQFVDPLLGQLRELNLRWLDNPKARSCQCHFIRTCPNLEVLHTHYVCGDSGLDCISKLCKKLRKLTVYSGTCVGLMAVAQGCPNLEYLHVKLTHISNEALECIGSNLKNLRVFYIRVQQKEDEEHTTIIPLDNGILAMLIGCPKLERLSLVLYPEVLTNVGLGFIGKYGVNMRELSLASIGGSDEGLMELSKGCPKLRKLKLTHCPFSYEAVKDVWLNIKSLRYIWFKSGNDTGLILTRPDFDMLVQLQTMREQTAMLKAEVESAAQKAASLQNTFKEYVADFNRQQSQAGCSSFYTPPQIYTPQAVPDCSGSSSRWSSLSSQHHCSEEQFADMMREYEVEIAWWGAQAMRVLQQAESVRKAFKHFSAYRQQSQALITPEVVPGISAPQLLLPNPTPAIPCEDEDEDGAGVSQSDDE